MRRLPYRSLALIAVALVALAWVPLYFVESLRAIVVRPIAWVWEPLASQGWIHRPLNAWSASARVPELEEELARLQLENAYLEAQMETLLTLEEYQAVLHQLNDDLLKEEGTLRYTAAQAHLKRQLRASPARVIYRSPSSWSSVVWIDIGSKHNIESGQTVIAKDSPVILGRSLVGLVDYVGTAQSRVRLLSDRSLVPSVRVLRRGPNGEKVYLAKGELHGHSEPLWRSPSNQLRGIGFNYDFADTEGPARDLRTGKPFDDSGATVMPILQEGDLLVTTGMDGLFPRGLDVALVDHIDMLQEGSYTYALDATPTAGNLMELSLVFVVPPLGYDPDDTPASR